MDKNAQIISGAIEVLHRNVDTGTPAASLDPRAKIIVTAVFVTVVVSYSKYSVLDLLPYFAFPLFLIVIGSISLKALFKRMLPAAVFAVMVGIANPFLDPNQVVINNYAFSAGWVSFLSILIRFSLCAAAAFLLILTTEMSRINMALKYLGVPDVFINQMFFMERYIVLLADEALKISRARAARSFGKKGYGITVFTNIITNLLLRTYTRAENIFNAMQSRGFTGTLVRGNKLKWKLYDTLFLLSWIIFFLSVKFNLIGSF